MAIVNGTPGDDTISQFAQPPFRTTANADQVTGDLGNDSILGAQGNDVIYGDLPNETASDGMDSIRGGDDNDRIFGGGGNDIIFGGVSAGTEVVGSDYIFGGSGSDVLFGGHEQIPSSDHLVGNWLVRRPGEIFEPIDFVIQQTQQRESTGDLKNWRMAETRLGVFLESDVVKAVDTAFVYVPAGASLSLDYESPGANGIPGDPVAGWQGGRVKMTVVGGGNVWTDYLYGVEYVRPYAVLGDLVSDAARLFSQPGLFDALLGVPGAAGTPADSPLAKAHLIPISQWRIDVTRLDNGKGSIQLFQNDVEIDINHEDKWFAWDDATPIDPGTYQAYYRTDARSSRADGPGAIELINAKTTTAGTAVQRDTIQLHWTTDANPNGGSPTPSEGCLTLDAATIQSIERLILGLGGKNTDQYTFKSLAASADVFRGGTGVGAGGSAPPPHNYLDLFWQSGGTTDFSRSKIVVNVRDGGTATLTQPTVTVHPFWSGGRGGFDLKISEPGDNRISKDLLIVADLDVFDAAGVRVASESKTNVEIRISASSGRTIYDNNGSLDVEAGGNAVLHIKSISPQNTYGSYTAITGNQSTQNSGIERFKQLFFEGVRDPIFTITTTRQTDYVLLHQCGPNVTYTTTLGGLQNAPPNPSGPSDTLMIIAQAATGIATLGSSLPTSPANGPPAIVPPPGYENVVVLAPGGFTLVGDGGSNALVGGDGDDVIIGGLGADTLDGGGGANVFAGSLAEFDADRITRFNVNDTVLFTNTTLTAAQISFQTGSVIVTVDVDSDGVADSQFSIAQDLIELGFIPTITNTAAGTELRFLPAAAGSPPAGTSDTYTTDEDTPLVIAAPGVLANDSDPNGDPITAIKLTNPTKGTVTLNANGGFTYTPSLNATGADSFTYQVSDGEFTSPAVTVSLTITPVNDAPTDIALAGGAVAENSPVGTAVGGLSATDVDDTPATLVFALLNDAGGRFVLDGATLRTAAVLDFEAAPSHAITVRVTDSGGLSFDKGFTVRVTDVNEAPVAANDAFTGPEDLSITGNVLANDFDPDGTALSAVLVNGPANGLLVLNANGSFTYTPNANYFGADGFTYRASDGVLTSAIATVTLTVTAVNDAPENLALAGDTVAENSPVGTVVGTFSATDMDGDPLTYGFVGDPGPFAIVGTQLRVAGPIDFESTPTLPITVRVSDGVGGVMDRSFTITVLDVNEGGGAPPPTAAPDTYALARGRISDVAAGFGLGANDSGLGPLSFALLDGPPAGQGSVAVNPDGSFTYTADADFVGLTGFTYTLTDAAGLSTTGTVTLTVEERAETLIGTDGDDRIFGYGLDDVIEGGAGNDRLFAGSGNDTVRGGDGGDRILGEDGDDTLSGEAGNDVIWAGAGNDVIDGGDGNDVLVGESGNDVINGGAGNDNIRGQAGDDVIDGGAGGDYAQGGDGDDVIAGGDGNDLLYGDAGDDLIRGDAGDDMIYGGDGHDVLIGGAGNDRIWGGDGDDRIVGGAGLDILDGGAGADIFVLAHRQADRDWISGFVSGEDRLEIEAALFGGGLAPGALDPSRLVVGANPTATLPGVGQFLFNTTTGQLRWDADGASGAAPQIIASLSGTTSLSSTDFFVV